MNVQAPISFHSALDDRALDQLFRQARTHNVWLKKQVPEALLRQAVDLAKMGPTHANAQPGRVLFVRSAEGKELDMTAQFRSVFVQGRVQRP